MSLSSTYVSDVIHSMATCNVHYADDSTVPLLYGDRACDIAAVHSSISVYLATK